ncbi:hypothetical protein MTP99_017882 [Tenebrio molitor]|nr:hypothetical protein MTP99_017882 [Tenebrio molitor]
MQIGSVHIFETRKMLSWYNSHRLLYFCRILVLELICTQRVKGHPRRDNCVVEKPHHLTCHKRLSTFGDEFPPDIRVLELRNIEQADLDLDLLLERFPDIENVSIFGGNISQIRPPILKNKIRVLQMVHVGVESIGNKFLGNFPNLQTLNLQGNYLQRLPNNFSVTKLDSLYLSGESTEYFHFTSDVILMSECWRVCFCVKSLTFVKPSGKA